jgi:hypothetical protein
LALINGLLKWISGASGRERTRNTDLLAQRTRAIEERDKAIAARDAEAAKRRILAEYASGLRRQLIENGLTPADWPDLERTQPSRPRRPHTKKEQ